MTRHGGAVEVIRRPVPLWWVSGFVGTSEDRAFPLAADMMGHFSPGSAALHPELRSGHPSGVEDGGLSLVEEPCIPRPGDIRQGNLIGEKGESLVDQGFSPGRLRRSGGWRGWREGMGGVGFGLRHGGADRNPPQPMGDDAKSEGTHHRPSMVIGGFRSGAICLRAGWGELPEPSGDFPGDSSGQWQGPAAHRVRPSPRS